MPASWDLLTLLMWQSDVPGSTRQCQRWRKHGLKSMTKPFRPCIPIVLLLMVSLVLWWRPLRITYTLALTNDAHTHILLILPLSAALIYLVRKDVLADGKPAAGFGIPLLAFALMVAGIAKWKGDVLPPDVALLMSMSALTLWWIGSFVFCFGL